jgi:hypothetical protein
LEEKVSDLGTFRSTRARLVHLAVALATLVPLMGLVGTLPAEAAEPNLTVDGFLDAAYGAPTNNFVYTRDSGGVLNGFLSVIEGDDFYYFGFQQGLNAKSNAYCENKGNPPECFQKFGDLRGSDHITFEWGNLVIPIDIISEVDTKKHPTTPSGYIGRIGTGDGGSLSGASASDVTGFSGMDYNMNVLGWTNLLNSPNFAGQPNQPYIYPSVAELRVKKTAFPPGTNPLQPTVVTHNSPAAPTKTQPLRIITCPGATQGQAGSNVSLDITATENSLPKSGANVLVLLTGPGSVVSVGGTPGNRGTTGANGIATVVITSTTPGTTQLRAVLDLDNDGVWDQATEPSTEPTCPITWNQQAPNPDIEIVKTGPTTRNVGQTADYTLTVTNPGNVPLSNVRVTDTKCNAAPVRQPGAQGGDVNSDNILQVTETWIYTCSRLIVTADVPSVTNIATAIGTPPTGADVDDSDDHVVTVPVPSAPVINIVKTGPTTRNVGETADYTLTVTNPGNVSLSNVRVTDTKCNNQPVRQSGDVNNNNVLEVTETWIYTCSRVIVSADVPSVRNVATAIGTPPTGNDVSDDDDHVVTVPAPNQPRINIDKTGPATRNVGETATYTLTVTNPGNVSLSNVRVTDDKCNNQPVRQSGDVNANNVLEVTETWTYTCSRVIVSADVPSVRNVATAIGTPPTGADVRDDDDHTVTVPQITVVEPAINIVKSGPAEAQRGDTITYTLTVTIPVDVPLTNVAVTDPRCDQSPTLQAKKGGDQDDVLEFGEVWTYTCPHRITNSDPNPLPNTATATGTGPNNEQVSDQDSHLVDLVPDPRIRIQKDGPQKAKVGDTITYTLEVFTPVDRPLHNVKVSDPKCDNEPKLQSKAGGDNDNLLEIGEVWRYTCNHKVTNADVGVLKNTSDVSGRDERDKKVTDRDSHVVDVTEVQRRIIEKPPPPSGPLPFTGFTATFALMVAIGLLTAGTLSLILSGRESRRRKTG